MKSESYTGKEQGICGAVFMLSSTVIRMLKRTLWPGTKADGAQRW